MISRNPNDKLNLVIYRDRLLAPTETFISAQGEALSGYSPFYFGMTRVVGIELPAERTVLLSDGSAIGRIQEVLFKATGRSRRLRNQLLLVRPCLVHAHFGFDGTNILPLAHRLRLPLIVTYHGQDATILPEYLRQFRYGRRFLQRQQLMKERCNQFIAVSEFIRRKLLDKSFPEEKIVVHYIGIDNQVFRPRSTILREPMVLFVGRLIEKKGCEFLIRAMQAVQETVPNVALVIVGEGPLRASLERQAMSSLRHFTFVGLQTPEQIRGWMSRATVQCVPSVTAAVGDSEGLPTVVLEAMAMGTPVCAFSSAGIPEAIVNAESGLLAPERDWRTLTANIVTLFTDQGAWESISHAGKDKVRRDFDLRKQCVKLEKIYSETLHRQGMHNNE